MVSAAALLTPSLLAEVSEANLRAILTQLSTYPTRNTNTAECESACRWVAGELSKLPRMQVELMEYELPAGRRVPNPKKVVQVVATLPGRTSKRVIVGGHLDTMSLAGDPFTAIAPGIDDDGSGVALTMECARILARRSHENTLVFVAFTGEEQGLYGSTALANRAKTENWTIEAMLNNDTVGASRGKTARERRTVRLYSEESETHRSRELARLIEWTGRRELKGFSAMLVYRRDRFRRGGDHTPFANAGYNAVRFIETYEALDRQHTERDTLDGIDFSYLANVTRLNLAALQGLANAGDAPTEVSYEPSQSHDTTVRWRARPGVTYRIYWRETASPAWSGSKTVTGDQLTIKGVNKDHHFFAVGAEGGVPVPLDEER